MEQPYPYTVRFTTAERSALAEVAALRGTTSAKVLRDLVARELARLRNEPPPPPIPIKARPRSTLAHSSISTTISGPVLRAVASVWDTSEAALLGKTRTRWIAHARQAAMLLLRERAPRVATQIEIARFFRLDHTSVRYGLEQAELRAFTSVDYAERLARARALLGC
jgi:hypothetical protein